MTIRLFNRDIKKSNFQPLMINQNSAQSTSDPKLNQHFPFHHPHLFRPKLIHNRRESFPFLGLDASVDDSRTRARFDLDYP